MMQLGLGVLRLPPQDFWRMTPRELAAAFGGPAPQFARSNFDALMERYPD